MAILLCERLLLLFLVGYGPFGKRKKNADPLYSWMLVMVQIE
jgi:hypothetical protein